MILNGENVNLRPIKENDFKKYYEWHINANLRFQLAMHPFAITEKNERDWFDKATNDISNKRIIFSIEHKLDYNLIGYFQFNDICLINRNAVLGIVIGEEEYRGIGLGKEIINMGINYAKNYLGLRKISLEVISVNERAVKLYKEIGFVDEGNFRKHFYYNGQYFDIIRMAFFPK